MHSLLRMKTGGYQIGTLLMVAMLGWIVATWGTVWPDKQPAGPESQPNQRSLLAEPPAEGTRASEVGLTHGPLLGAVSDTAIKVWVRGEGVAVFQLQVKLPGETWPGTTFGPTSLESDQDFSGVIEADGLTPSSRYEYRALLNGIPSGGEAAFKTLAAIGQPGTFRFMVGGDLAANFAPYDVLDRVADQHPDFNLLTGDLVYADQPSTIPAQAEAYRAKYRGNWSDASFRRLTRIVPSFMTWDDHEIVNDYDGGESERYGAARAALDTYVARTNPSPRRANELYYSFQVADVDFFVLDTRSHRSRNAMADGANKTMLGADQKSELKSWLATSHGPFKLVLSSVPFGDLNGSSRDAWSSFGSERSEILEFIRARAIPGVVILSGDQHWSSLARFDSLVWEFNATPLAQQVRRPIGPDQSSALPIAYSDSPSFGIVDVDTRGEAPSMTFSIVDDGGAVRASHTIRSRES